MELFFNPGSVAVVGASPRNIGGFVLSNLLQGFDGGIYPVNSKYGQMQGIACYPSVQDIPEPVDLAVILVPARAVPSVLEDCASKGVPRVIIESAGFSESGSEGAELQLRCERIAEEAGMRLWGPNCMGVVDVINSRYFSFMNPEVREELLTGRISLIVQSGMMSAIFLAELGRRGIGVSKACSIGNRADVDECDVLGYLQDDPDTDAIAMYLESIPRGRSFARLAERSDKPVVLLKGGESRSGAVAAKSHTSSLSGDSRLMDSVLQMAGVIRAYSVYQMMDMADALAAIPGIDPACRTAILTLSGGAGILACDALERCGIRVAELDSGTKEEVARIFPSWMPVDNPVDLFPAVAQNGRQVAFEGALSAVLKAPDIDALVIHYVAGLEEIDLDFNQLRERAEKEGKVVLFWLMGREEGSGRFRQEARQAGIQVYEDVTRLAECLRAVASFSGHRRQREEQQEEEDLDSCRQVEPLASSEMVWDEYDSKLLLVEHGIPVVREQLAESAEQAEEAGQVMGYPVAIKGLVPGRSHKSEAGLVKLGVSDGPMLRQSFAELSAQVGDSGRILVQRQIDKDYELIAGFLRDESFGPCLMFGMGGFWAELEPDVVFDLAPVSHSRALEMVRSLRNYKLFNGFRGIEPLDEESAARILVGLGRMGAADPRICQIDVNPLAVRRGQPLALDATVVLGS